MRRCEPWDTIMSLQRLENLLLANSGSLTPAQALAELGTPSTSIAVLENGAISSVCHSTVGDDDATVFQACSISKPITALAIMRLIDDGHFTLESTVSQLLPADILNILMEGSPASQKSIIEEITVGQLMSHTSGLSVHGFGGYSSPDKIPSTADILLGRSPANNLRVRLELLPGFTYCYSGGGITVLQIILESVMGMPFPKILQEVVLGPLGMNRSFYGRLPKDENNAASAYLTGHVRADTPHHVQPELAAAGLWTTPTDLLKAVRAVQQSLKGGGFLKQETAKDMLTRRKANMGLSWFISPNDTDFSHGGANNPGFRCIVSGFAQLGDQSVPDNCGYAIMTNSAEGDAVIGQLGQALCYLNEWPLASLTRNVTPVTPFGDIKRLTGDLWRSYTGGWKDCDGNVYQIAENDGEPFLYYNGLGPIRMVPAATPGARNATGDVVSFVLEGLKLLLKCDQGILTVQDGEQRESRALERTAES
ncbi:hypothetical protein NLU13_3811 [Sarocladium strictum]|uniref:Beta-lactamase-related domain-containing protein n=1 Tax=Sarocladium strictum TaxID=5046 RepID=A0AA39GHQ6_SARSR|nr:hypothetical protein NLU13_3811 [Sarocladium strictum]